MCTIESSSWNLESERQHKRMATHLDRITNLPDSVVHHILTFLDMRQVVQTSVLSPKWKDQWKSLQCLNFDKENWDISCFEQFVDNVVFGRDDKLDVYSIYLNCDEDIKPQLIESWIKYALNHNVQQLDLTTNTLDAFELPESLFTSNSLRKLNLATKVKSETDGYERFELDLPKSISLPGMKDLHLQSLCFGDAELATHLISSCPILESLTITDCILDSMEHFFIRAPNLKHFSVRSVHDNIFANVEEECIPDGVVFEIHAPNLLSYVCKDYVFREHHLHKCSSLERAEIGLKLIEYYEYSIYLRKWQMQVAASKKVYDKRIVRCLEDVSHVKTLSLSAQLLEFVSQSPTILGRLRKPFWNVRCLKLNIFLSRASIFAVMQLINLSPMIETLVLHSKERCFTMDSTCQKWNVVFDPVAIAEYHVAGLALHHLKLFRMEKVKGSCYELKFLRIVLEAASIMEKMVVVTSSNLEMSEFREELISLPRRSSHLEIMFSSK